MKKIFFLFLITMCIPILDKYEIDLKRVFDQKNKEYTVLFYLDSCLACRNTKMFLIEKEKRERKKVYFVNFELCEFKKENSNSNLNVSSYLDLNIKVVPTILIIKDYQVIKEFIGYKDIINNY